MTININDYSSCSWPVTSNQHTHQNFDVDDDFVQYTMEWFKRHCTCLVGRKRLSWHRSSLGWRCHGDEENPRRILCESEQYWIGQKRFWPTEYGSDSGRKLCRIDILRVTDLKKWVNGGTPISSGNLESTIWNSHCFDGIALESEFC